MKEASMKSHHLNRILIASTFISAVSAGLVATKPALAGNLRRPLLLIPVSTCKTIAAAGSYIVTTNLGPVPGVCIKITAPNVTLSLGGHTLTGDATSTIGVEITTGASSVHLVNGRITGFTNGVVDFGATGTLANLTIYANRALGAYLKGSTGSTLAHSSFRGNGAFGIELLSTVYTRAAFNTVLTSGRYGIWVKSSTEFKLDHNAISSSGIAGIYVGCSPNGVTNVLTCPRSNGGMILANSPIDNNKRLGIAIDRGNKGIRVSGNHVSGSGVFDLFDSNPGCGLNTWSADVYTTHNRACAV
jgi:hypothetical protein